MSRFTTCVKIIKDVIITISKPLKCSHQTYIFAIITKAYPYINPCLNFFVMSVYSDFLFDKITPTIEDNSQLMDTTLTIYFDKLADSSENLPIH